MATYNETITDNLDVGDTPSMGIPDALSLADSIEQAVVIYQVLITESLNLADSVTTAGLEINRIITDTLLIRERSGIVYEETITDSLDVGDTPAHNPRDDISFIETITGNVTKQSSDKLSLSDTVTHTSTRTFVITDFFNLQEKINFNTITATPLKYGLYTNRNDIPPNITINYNANVTFDYNNGLSTIILPKPILNNSDNLQLIQARNRLRGNVIKTKTKRNNTRLSLTFNNIKNIDLSVIKTFIQVTTVGKIIKYTSHENFVYECIITNPNTSIRNTVKTGGTAPRRYELNLELLVVSHNLRSVNLITLNNEDVVTFEDENIIRLTGIL